MDYIQILRRAEDKLTTSHPEVVIEIRELISAGSTGGEITSMVGKYLKDLGVNNKRAYLIMEDEIHLFLLHCKRQGLDVI